MSPSDKADVDVVDSMVVGFITDARAGEIEAACPGVAASIVGWVRDSAADRNWPRVERLANLAARLQPPGLGEALRELIDADIKELNNEDLVDILGEIQDADSASSIFGLVQRSFTSDAPAYWLCQKAILSLSTLETVKADAYLLALTKPNWPNPIRWHAAVALQIEDSLGFIEDDMLD